MYTISCPLRHLWDLRDTITLVRRYEYDHVDSVPLVRPVTYELLLFCYGGVKGKIYTHLTRWWHELDSLFSTRCLTRNPHSIMLLIR